MRNMLHLWHIYKETRTHVSVSAIYSVQTTDLSTAPYHMRNVAIVVRLDHCHYHGRGMTPIYWKLKYPKPLSALLCNSVC